MLTRLNQVMHGWAIYFRHAVAKSTFSTLDNFAWWRMIRMLTHDTAGGGRTSAGSTRPGGEVAAHQRGRHRTAADRGHTGDPVPLPRQQGPQPLDSR